MKRYYFLICAICLIQFGLGATTYPKDNTASADSLNYVVDRIMSYDLFINSYVVGDAELDWVEQEHPDWIDRYYSTIIETFDCTLYSKFALAVGLYRRGNLDAINKLWLDYSYLFYVDGVRNEDYPIKQIWQLLDWAEINPVEVVLSNIVK